MTSRSPDGPCGVTRTVLVDGVPVALHLRRYALVVTEGPDRGKRVLVRSRVARIGGSPDSDLCLEDPTASRHHCRIEADGFGYRVLDLDSKNGTFLDGIRVRDAYLRPGCSLRVGSTLLRFEPGEEEEEVRFSTRHSFGDLLGESLAMREVFAALERVAASDATVLLEGESGTGKELAARAIHDRGNRRHGPFVVFDCSAVPPNLLESELFGHQRGAFTGAVADRTGAMVEADGGTLFLDEVGELGPDLQPKLLRAIEEKCVRPVGSSRPMRCDIRLIAATNRNLAREVELGRFRKDLYWRLAVIVIRMPALRERPEDIPLLLRHFLRKLGRDPDRFSVSYETMARLKEHSWPGNVRELRNFVERAVVLSGEEGGAGSAFLDVPLPAAGEDPSGRSGPVPPPCRLEVDLSLPFKEAKSRLVDEFEAAYWRGLLASTGGNVSEAARRAGIHRKSAEYLLRKLDLRR